MKRLDRFLAKLYDARIRSPRGLGFTVDDGLPDRGTRYGGAQTIHNTGTIDVVVDDSGKIVDVWFRCANLPFRVTKQGTGRTEYSTGKPNIVAIEFAEEQ